ncbi:thiopurine S-methyltransferase [Thalassotalea maritima]|uniref:thiopurine S-methyltransferase n=1 Tax=Thalassotalea maritima TaxID=3242416 RepID=UPI00352932E9
MQQDFWHNCWDKNSTGWHQSECQPMLAEYLPSLWRATDQHIFVPLCGKSDDLVFLTEHGKVVGNELSAIACQQFFSEHKLAYTTQEKQPFTVYQSANIDIYQGDFFSLNVDDFQTFDWIYDRAALIALPESMQVDYVAKLKRFFGANTRLFLLTLEYDQQQMSGPPFNIDEQRVNRLFKGLTIEKLASRELADSRFAQRTFPVSKLVESLYIISL